MTDRAGHEAQSALVAIVAVLALQAVRDENFGLWRDCLRDLLPDCTDCAEAVVPLRVAAEALVVAGPAGLGSAMARVRIEVRQYYLGAAAARVERWRGASGRAAP